MVEYSSRRYEFRRTRPALYNRRDLIELRTQAGVRELVLSLAG